MRGRDRGRHCWNTNRHERVAEPQWTLHLLDQLAEYYFITVEPDGDDLSRVTPPAWHAAHDATAASLPASTAVLLGYNALLSNDLPQAVADLLRERWPLTAARLERRYQDVRLVGDIAARTVAAPAGLLDAWVEDAWCHALMLVTAVDDTWRDAIRDCVEHTAARRAHLITCRIADRNRLLALPAAELDRRFPARHDAGACLQRIPLPNWGVPAAAAS